MHSFTLINPRWLSMSVNTIFYAGFHSMDQTSVLVTSVYLFMAAQGLCCSAGALLCVVSGGRLFTWHLAAHRGGLSLGAQAR